MQGPDFLGRKCRTLGRGWMILDRQISVAQVVGTTMAIGGVLVAAGRTR